jgi:DNA topoisomerase-1
MQKSLPSADASAPSLIFTSDEMPGYSRRRRGAGFSYLLPGGSLLKDKRERQRIASLAIPPAYESVWICRVANGHLQATGLDARGRKQYVYHPAWFEIAAERKFTELPGFAATLPRIRSACRKALADPELTRERVIAGIVFLLDRTGYRIGNARYEKENRSFGLSSLHMRHVRLGRNGFRMRFRGKSGMDHETEVGDAAIVKLILDLQDLPGQHLFRYEGEDGTSHDIDSSDVNRWIREASGGDYSAKMFRTWKATVLCALELKKEPPPATKAGVERVIRAAIKGTAEALRHTVATCRKYYIHPAVLQAYREGHLHVLMNRRAPALRRSNGTAGLHANERRVYQIITRARTR